MWTVDELEIDGTMRPPALADETRWRRVFFSFPGQVSVQLMNNSRLRYNIKLDAAKGTIEMARRENPKQKSTLAYKQPGPGLLTLEGMSAEHEPIRARLHRTKPSSFLLLKRGFHFDQRVPLQPLRARLECGGYWMPSVQDGLLESWLPAFRE